MAHSHFEREKWRETIQVLAGKHFKILAGKSMFWPGIKKRRLVSL
jgi:hypothetical protein